MTPVAPPLIVIAGATGTGKTDLAIALGEALQARGRAVTVISADSRQVFRGLDIGTAKVTATERARVPHAGLDLVDPDAPFSVASFVAHAQGVLADLAARDGVAILAGGTGLYLRAIARGIATDALPSDPELRDRLEADLIRDGLEAVLGRLTTVAPRLAADIDQRNPRRVVRALEIATLQGDGPRPVPRGYPAPVTWIGLRLDDDRHRARLEARARAQFATGLIEEARGLRERFDPARPAFSAIGYREAWAVLDGETTEAAAIDLDAQRNVAFAKRQRIWFRAEPDITWLDADRPGVERAALTLMDGLLGGGR